MLEFAEHAFAYLGLRAQEYVNVYEALSFEQLVERIVDADLRALQEMTP